MNPIISFAIKTDVGKVRKVNEDSIGYDQNNILFVVCDGVGGHYGGDIASQTTVKTINWFFNLKNIDIKNIVNKQLPEKAAILLKSVQIANRQLFNLVSRYPLLQGMGTTVSALTFEENYAYIVNVGDSRVYRIRNDEIIQLTRDHSWVSDLLNVGEISKEEAKRFKHKNVITRVLGTAPSIKVDLKIEKIRPDDIFLICSDGLYGAIEDENIISIILKNKIDLDEACEKLINLANQNGGSDNISIILVKIINVKNDFNEDKDPEEKKIEVYPEEDKKESEFNDSILKKYNQVIEIPKEKKIVKKSFLDRASWFIPLLMVLTLVSTFYFYITVFKPKKIEFISLPIQVKASPVGTRVSVFHPLKGKITEKIIEIDTPIKIELLEDLTNYYKFEFSKPGYVSETYNILCTSKYGIDPFDIVLSPKSKIVIKAIKDEELSYDVDSLEIKIQTGDEKIEEGNVVSQLIFIPQEIYVVPGKREVCIYNLQYKKIFSYNINVSEELVNLTIKFKKDKTIEILTTESKL